MGVDSPAAIKDGISSKVAEIVCDDVRGAVRVLGQEFSKSSLQAFGDRLNIIMSDIESDLPKVKAALQEASIKVSGIREIPPSLENVFISLMSRSPEESATGARETGL